MSLAFDKTAWIRRSFLCAEQSWADAISLSLVDKSRILSLIPIGMKCSLFLIDVCDWWLLLLYCTIVESDRFIAIGNINLAQLRSLHIVPDGFLSVAEMRGVTTIAGRDASLQLTLVARYESVLFREDVTFISSR